MEFSGLVKELVDKQLHRLMPLVCYEFILTRQLS
jgi:hypothetical protein